MASSSQALSAPLRTRAPPIPFFSRTSSSWFPVTNRSFRGSSGLFSTQASSSSISVIRANNPEKFSCLKTKVSTSANMATEKKAQVFDSEEALSVSLAKYIADLSEKFIKQKGSFTVVVSGGSLIKSLRKLVEAPYVDSIDWSKWHMFWVDERVVPKDHPDSNYLLAFDSFLSKVPIPPGNIYAINDALSAEGAADDYETCIKHMVHNGVISTSEASGIPKFDLMLLGMGPDGHVASLFPGHPLLQEKSKWVAFIKESPKPPPERITFTFPVINSSANVVLVVAGAGKAHPVHVALGDGQDPELLPVQMVSPEGELTWFLDKDAASKL
ncbi:probable 6-phosphogluconolactonase 4, chloroplastic isoform X1 [Cynara cardunculus var. scolymus]|uniref:Probable 6-phosphogluconolactonase n=2 Tax=Cynara cardunculus var. scolymus TaxID=59895 RepID=A0A103Y8U3_CYNCS|nr:probable 6-phosphogluconolactonase 4, chloroplastic isoform X1 [Cynara cardunculus var. scolymus]KVI04640.1 6-phosphogluconolactonase, DevB-type [Cynara cardunculus var. scolymus]